MQETNGIVPAILQGIAAGRTMFRRIYSKAIKSGRCNSLSTGGQATFVTNSGGIVDMSFLTSGGMTAGSIAGAGDYYLGSNALTVGGNNTSTEVSGGIFDGGGNGGTGGSLIKVGTGTLIDAGTLQIGNGGTTGSITDNAALAFDRSDSYAFGGSISGTGL
jgi:hypothetical protein